MHGSVHDSAARPAYKLGGVSQRYSRPLLSLAALGRPSAGTSVRILFPI